MIPYGFHFLHCSGGHCWQEELGGDGGEKGWKLGVSLLLKSESCSSFDRIAVWYTCSVLMRTCVESARNKCCQLFGEIAESYPNSKGLRALNLKLGNFKM